MTEPTDQIGEIGEPDLNLDLAEINEKEPLSPSLIPDDSPFVGLDERLVNPHGLQGSPNVLPGFEGLPWRGRVPDLKKDEIDERVAEGYEARVDVLDMSKPEEVERYRKIYQMIANGFARMGEERVIVDQVHLTWKFMLRWWLVYSHAKAASDQAFRPITSDH